MPVTRYQIRNEYGLADPELYRAADRDDPEALLEGVAMAGLVGVLRQLGDLAEFAAEIFHDLHEEVMATATRGHGLMVRVRQLEADFPSIEKALLSQTNHASFFSNTGVDWHPNLRCKQNLVTRGDLPRFVMDSYEECRGPPRLFLLDKFDVAGAGACLKRYTDPSFFKVESTYSFSSVDMQRERKIRKVKQKKGSCWRNAETPEILLPSHAKLHELFLEERIENGYSDPARRVKLKKRHLNGSAIDSKTKKSYMDKFMETRSPERILVCASPVTSPLLNLSSDNKNESGMRILDISIVSPAEKSPERNSASSSTNDQEVISKQSVDGLNGGSFYEETIGKVSVPNSDGESDNSYSNLQMVAVEKELEVDEDKTEGSVEGYNSDDFPSEVDNYVDALATLESEMDTDNESRPKSNPRLMKVEKRRRDSDVNEVEHVELQAQSLDSQSNESSSLSDECNNSFERDRASLHSDTLSKLVENLPSECNGAAKEFPSAETYGTKETRIHEGIHPDSGDISCNKLVREMSPTQRQPDRGENSPVASHMEPLLEKTSSGEVKVGSDSFDTKENETNLDHSMAVVPGDSSHAKNQFANTSLMLPLVEADEEDLGATSDDLLHLKNIEELTSVNPSGNNYVNEVYQTKCTDEDAVGSFFSRKVDAPVLSTPSTEDQLFPSAMKEVQTSLGTALLPHNSDVEKPVNRVSVVEDSVKPTAFKSGVIPWRRISRGSVAEGDAPRAHEQKDVQQTHVLKDQTDARQTHVLMDQKISDLHEDVSHCEDNFNVEERSRTVDGEEIGLFTSSVDPEGGDYVSMELPSNSPAYSGHGDHLLSADIEPATVHEELPLNFPSHSGLDTVLETSPEVPQAMSNNIENGTAHADDLAVTAKSDDVNDIDTDPAAICSPPLSFMNLPESLPDFRDSHLKESEVDDVASPKFISDSELHKEASNREVLPDSDSDPGISVARDASSSKVFDDDLDFSLDEQSGNGTTVCDVPTASTSLEMTNQESESQSLYQSHGEYALSSSSFALADPVLREAETKLKIFLELQANQADMENLEEDGASDQLEAALERSPESHSDQLGKEHLQEDQAITDSSISQSEDSRSPDQCDKEISKLPSMIQINQQTCLGVSESIPDNLPSQHSTSVICTESAGQETDLLKQKMELLESIPPNCVQPPVVNLEDTPPLPPLPPMQWRLGKVQHASLASQREMEGAGQHLFFPMQPLKADEHTLFDLPEMRRELRQPTNPFLPLAAEDIKSGPFSGPSMGHVVPPGPYLQVPNDNDSDQQNNFSDLGGIQFSSPFIQSEICGDSSGHNDIALEGENGQTSSKPFTVPGTECSTSRQDPVFSHGDIVHPPHVTGLELEVCQQSFSNSKLEPARPLATSVTAPTMEEEQPQHSLPKTEGENVQSTSKPLTVPLATSVTAPTMEEEQPQHNLPITEGENVQSTSKPLTVPGSEFTTSRHDPSFSHGETIQFLQQLPQDSSLEPENLCQALLDSEKEQENPLTGSITSTNKVDEKPQHSVPTSEVETAWSSEASNTSEVMPDSEVGKFNGTVNKLPRPRNPLIDAVTAHGQSKLKKASERIQPQVEPKVDERDLFLQQIRTKSFNLKPATVTRSTPRPNIQVHNPNLKVISLLEKKAIAIRQAFAGSDEDDDDSWSDS